MIRRLHKPLPTGKPGKPEHFRAMLIVFTIRHLLGVAVFAYLIRVALAGGGPFWMVLVALCACYAAFAIYNGGRLLGQYRRTSRRQALERSAASGFGA